MLTALGVGVGLIWQGALQAGWLRVLLFAGAILSLMAALAVLVRVGLIADFGAVVASVAMAVLGWRAAFGPREPAGGRWQPAPAARPVTAASH